MECDRLLSIEKAAESTTRDSVVRVAALTSGRNVASSRFRIRQHVARLREHRIDVDEWTPHIDKFTSWNPSRDVSPLLRRGVHAALSATKLTDRLPAVMASRFADVTWIDRELLAGRLTLEPLLGRPLIFDIDDAIWAGSEEAATAARRIARLATTVIAGNAHIAAFFASVASNVRIIHTAIDTERFVPASREQRPFTIGWTGSSSTLRYLRMIDRPLAQFLRAHDARLLVMCDRAPELDEVDRDRVLFERWSEEREVSAVQRMDVGLMPLPDDEWARGKCSFKMLQYMACGVPVVVSPIGLNAEILVMSKVGFAAMTPSEWQNALHALFEDATLRERLGAAGRRLAEERFSSAVIAPQIAAAIRDAAERA